MTIGIDPALLARYGSLAIKARVIVEGALSGMHRASVHGSSVEFAQHKEYSPGDELRHVDWKAYAKQDRYYVKQFEQESQLTVYLVLDASASMAFGGGAIPKIEYAGLALAAIAYLVVQQQDKVGLLACGDKQIETFVPPRGRTNHLHDLLGVLDGVVTAGGRGDESPAHALQRIAELARRKRALIVVASDLFDAEDETLATLARLRAQRHDVSVLHLIDPHERAFPYDGLTQFESLESAHKLLVNPNAVRADYLARMAAFLARCKSAMADAGVDYHLVATDQPVERTLLDLIMARSRLGPGKGGGRDRRMEVG
ncbi:MAG: DUF58 domain-containing protein [Deltaproteobacteria bacterium]|nr:DUF58 domain-containing protein [Deltaproteobacteria bacterium]MCW5804568.1 DUF58 domain-containing protein [Deltaproteobacteria bacterium]